MPWQRLHTWSTDPCVGAIASIGASQRRQRAAWTGRSSPADGIRTAHAGQSVPAVPGLPHIKHDPAAGGADDAR
jgi:hypothetical protein